MLFRRRWPLRHRLLPRLLLKHGDSESYWQRCVSLPGGAVPASVCVKGCHPRPEATAPSRLRSDPATRINLLSSWCTIPREVNVPLKVNQVLPPLRKIILQMHTPAQVSAGVGKPSMDLECASGCTWSTARATARLRDSRPW